MMDESRILHLEEMSGLRLDPAERLRLMADLAAIDHFVVGWLEPEQAEGCDEREDAGDLSAPEGASRPTTDFDQDVLTENSSSWVPPFFEVPPVDTTEDDGSS